MEIALNAIGRIEVRHGTGSARPEAKPRTRAGVTALASSPAGRMDQQGSTSCDVRIRLESTGGVGCQAWRHRLDPSPCTRARIVPPVARAPALQVGAGATRLDGLGASQDAPLAPAQGSVSPAIGMARGDGSSTQPCLKSTSYTISSRGAATVRKGVPARLAGVGYHCATAPVHCL